ncbi:MAG: DJ-1/PfpI family protein [Candidatus Gracilibacteria bacterium]
MHALFLIAKENFRDEELFEPQKILKTAGIETTVTSVEDGMATGSRGGSVKIDKPIKDIHMEDYDILILIGGPGSPALGDYEEVINLIKKAHSLAKPLAAICIAPYLLAKAGVITGKKATSFPGEPAISEFIRKGVTRIQQPVLTDGDLITADGPASAKDFGQEIIKLLSA